MSLRRWLLAPVMERLESLLFARLTEIDHKLTTVAQTIHVRSEQRWPTTVCVLWSEVETKPYSSGLDDIIEPRAASACAWLGPDEHKELIIPLFRALPAGAWVVSLGPAHLRSVHVANRMQDAGGGPSSSLCVISEAVKLGTQLRATLHQPPREAAYRL
jgi:hypothetical protein